MSLSLQKDFPALANLSGSPDEEKKSFYKIETKAAEDVCCTVKRNCKPKRRHNKICSSLSFLWHNTIQKV